MGVSREGIVSSCKSVLFLCIFVFTIFAPLASANHADEGLLDYLYSDNPEANPSFKYAPGFLQQISKASYEIHKFQTDAVVGLFQGAQDTIKGISNLSKGTVKLGIKGLVWQGYKTYQTVTDPSKTWNEVKQTTSNFASDPLGNIANAGKVTANFAGNVVTGYASYIADCPQGHVGRCFGKAGFEALSFEYSAGKFGPVIKLAEKAKATAQLKKAGETQKATKVKKVDTAKLAAEQVKFTNKLSEAWTKFKNEFTRPLEVSSGHFNKNTFAPYVGPHVDVGPVSAFTRPIGNLLFGNAYKPATNFFEKAIREVQSVTTAHPVNPFTVGAGVKGFEQSKKEQKPSLFTLAKPAKKTAPSNSQQQQNKPSINRRSTPTLPPTKNTLSTAPSFPPVVLKIAQSVAPLIKPVIKPVAQTIAKTVTTAAKKIAKKIGKLFRRRWR